MVSVTVYLSTLALLVKIVFGCIPKLWLASPRFYDINLCIIYCALFFIRSLDQYDDIALCSK